MDGTVTASLGPCIVDGRTTAVGVHIELSASQLSITTPHPRIPVAVFLLTMVPVDGCSAAEGVHAELSVSELSVTTDPLVVIVDFSGTAGCVVAVQFRPNDGNVAWKMTADISFSTVQSSAAAAR